MKTLLTFLIVVGSCAAQNNPTSNPNSIPAGCAGGDIANTAYAAMGVTKVTCVTSLQYGSVGQSSCVVIANVNSCEVTDCYAANAFSANNIYVILAHSGGDNSGSRTQLFKLTNGSALFAQMLGPGYTVVSPDYILASIRGATPVNPMPKQWQDFRQLLFYLGSAGNTTCTGNINDIRIASDSMATYQGMLAYLTQGQTVPWADSGPQSVIPYTITKIGASYPSLNQAAICSGCGTPSIVLSQNETGPLNNGSTATVSANTTLTLGVSGASCTFTGSACTNFTYVTAGQTIWLSASGNQGTWIAYTVNVVTSNLIVTLLGSPSNGSFFVAGPTGADNFSLTAFQGLLGILPGNGSSPYSCATLACVTSGEAADLAGQFSPIWWATCGNINVNRNIFLGYGLQDTVVSNDTNIYTNPGTGTAMNGLALSNLFNSCGRGLLQNGYPGNHEDAILASTPLNAPVEDLANFIRTTTYYAPVRRRF